jgi:hypothetical protein
MIIGLPVKYLLFLSDFIKLKLARQSFERYSNIKFNENPFSGNRVVLFGWRERQTDGQT